MLIDTSVWIDFFRGEETQQIERLELALSRREELLLGDLILMEILQGVRSKRERRLIDAAFVDLRVMPLAGEAMAREAASFYRTLRGQGTTVRKSIDCLIATWCIHHQISLLHNDRDFMPFVQFGLLEA